MSDAPCASGGLGANGECCPYVTHAMTTLEGHEAWDIALKGMTQLKIAPSGKIIGFDMPALMRLAQAQGYDLRAISELLPYIESGLLKAMRETHDSNCQ